MAMQAQTLPAARRPIIGHKKGSSGGSARTPVEDPDTLHNVAYLRLKEWVSEGEIYGPVGGFQNILKAIYLDGTPIQNADGSINFPGVKVDWRPGTQNQDPLPGFPSTERTVQINQELEFGTPITRMFTNTNVNAIRVNFGVTGLNERDAKTGDLHGYYVEYAIDLSTDGGPFVEVLKEAFDGKATQVYGRSRRIELTKATNNWQVRIRRLTPQSIVSTIQDITQVSSMVEIIDANLRHPMTAVVGLLLDAKTFPNGATRAYRMRGRIIEIPSNYDPETRTYSGNWDGTFKLGWTNCPPWIWRDIIVNKRYGLGNKIDASKVDKWNLYRIAQYCDELVPNGYGGMEPRFTANVFFQQAADAFKVIQDMASVFRGAAFWAGGTVVAAADIPTTDLFTFTNANVEGGIFKYAGSAKNTRYTIANVSYNDPDDFGRQKVMAVQDPEGIARYGLVSTDVTAFACDSPGQAQRVGRHILLSSQMETDGATWTINLERVFVMPGRVVKVADKNRAGREIGGRITEATRSQITMDRLTGVRPGDRISINLPSGIVETRVVASDIGTPLTADTTVFTADSTELTADLVGLPDETRIVRVTVPFSETPQPEAQWALESEELSVQRFRVLGLTYLDGMKAEVTAIAHQEGKFAFIDYETRLDPKPITVIPNLAQRPPRNVRIGEYSYVDQNTANHVGVIEWDAPENGNGVEYDVQWRRDRSDWIRTPGSITTRLELRNIYTGNYLVRVRAVNAFGGSSEWAYSDLTALTGLVGDPPTLAFLTASPGIFGINLAWGFPDVPAVIGKTEIVYSRSNNLGTAQPLGQFAYPQSQHFQMGLQAATQFYYWGRLYDKNDQPGPWYPIGPEGVVGQTNVDAQDYLDYFKGLFDEDVFVGTLREKLETLATGIGDLTTKLETERTLREAADGVLAQQIDTIAAVANGAAASVITERTARQAGDETLAQSLEVVRAANASTAAQVDLNRQAQINGDGALAQSIENVRVTANGASAGVQTNATAISNVKGDLSATYTVKVQINAYGQVFAAGMGIGAYDTGGGIQTAVYFLANRFAFITESNGQISVPFVVENGQTFISQAFIGVARITNAMIQDAAITTAKIGDAQITSAKIGNAQILVANIGDAQITTAKIGVAQVDTLRIGPNAVTVGTAGDYVCDYYHTGGDQDGNNAAVVSINVSQPTLIVAFYSVEVVQNNPGGGTYFSFRISSNFGVSRTYNPGQRVYGDTFISGVVQPGGYYLRIAGDRAPNTYRTLTGRIALLGFQR